MSTSNKAYTTFTIKKKLGVKIDRLKDWMNRGFIKPSIKSASGPGTKNLFSIEDLYRIKLFKLLIEKGFNREMASALIKTLAPNPYSNFRIDWGSHNLVYSEKVDMVDGKEKITVQPGFSMEGYEYNMPADGLFNIVIKLSEIKKLVDKMVFE
jgi:DNA-binding transcriptional MerR regulator